MGGIGSILDLVVIGLLGATMLYAARLHRALAALRHDRAALHDVVAGFDEGARLAEAGLARLRQAADQVGAQLDRATALRDDLSYLSDRGEGLADRLDAAVRAGRPMAGAAVMAEPVVEVRSQAERNLIVALQGRR